MEKKKEVKRKWGLTGKSRRRTTERRTTSARAHFFCVTAVHFLCALQELFVMECCSKRIALSRLKHETKYCLQAQIIIVHQAKSSARSSKKCVTTQG